MAERLSEIDLIREYLRDRPIGCPSCRYNLRGTTSDTCPECGARFELQLSPSTAQLGPWLIMLLAIALPLGFTLVFGASGAMAAIRQSVWWESSDWTIAGAAWLLSAFYAVLLSLVIRSRGRFLRRSFKEKRIVAYGVVIVMISLQLAVLYAFNRFGPAPF